MPELVMAPPPLKQNVCHNLTPQQQQHDCKQPWGGFKQRQEGPGGQASLLVYAAQQGQHKAVCCKQTAGCLAGPHR
jgi:hypothetical protein